MCTLLDTCGSFFCKGKAGRRLDRFLAYFQRYLLAKPPLPLDIDFDVQVSHKLGSACMPNASPSIGELVLQPCSSLVRHLYFCCGRRMIWKDFTVSIDEEVATRGHTLSDSMVLTSTQS